MVLDARALAWMTAWECLDSINRAHAKYGNDTEAVDLDRFTQRTQRNAEIYTRNWPMFLRMLVSRRPNC